MIISRKALGATAVAALALCMFLLSRARNPDSTTEPRKQSPDANKAANASAKSNPQQPVTYELFHVVASNGIDFVHNRGLTDQRHMPAANGSGLGIIDYDQDGRLDLFLATGNNLPIGDQVNLTRNALYRGAGWVFSDVSATSGVELAAYSHGVSAADWDNDGFPDIYVTCFGRNHFYRNNGDGTFKEVAAETGTAGQRWSSAAAPIDFDNDGDLDIYVSNYAKWSPETNPRCDHKGVPIFCRPALIPAEADEFYENLGNGSFQEVAAKIGITTAGGRGLGVIAVDLNNDNYLDIYVANDMSCNFLYANRTDGTFEDLSLVGGAGYNAEGKEEAGMGLDACDINGDGLPELVVTNYWMESHSLYRNDGDFRFADATNWAGLGSGSVPDIGWGTVAADFDSDGWPDLFVANGLLETSLDYEPRVPHRFWQNLGNGRFQRLQQGLGPAFETVGNARGVACGDFDGDGDLDLALSQMDDQPLLLENRFNQTPLANSHHWIRINLTGRQSNRDCIGARVEVELPDNRRIVRQINGGGSYLSTSERHLTIGVGSVEQLQSLSVTWPSGAVATLSEADLVIDRVYSFSEPF